MNIFGFTTPVLIGRATASLPCRSFPALCLCAFCLCAFLRARADSISVYEENDFLVSDGKGSNEDGWYTQGMQIQYVNTNDWGLTLGQQIYTPENKNSPLPSPGDRPYAGYLHAAYFQNILKGQQDDYFKIDAGIIGPAALGNEAQNGLHKLCGMALAKGWKYQLRNEPTLNAAYYKSFSHRFCPWFEYKPFAGVNFGNVLVDAELGNFVRMGLLSKSFNPTIYSFSSENRRMKDSDFYFYLFAGVVGQAIAYDHLLDGSLFQDEQVTVKHKPFVANGSVGACVGIYAFELTFTHCEVTEQWLSQPDRDNKFDSIKLTYKF